MDKKNSTRSSTFIVTDTCNPKNLQKKFQKGGNCTNTQFHRLETTLPHTSIDFNNLVKISLVHQKNELNYYVFVTDFLYSVVKLFINRDTNLDNNEQIIQTLTSYKKLIDDILVKISQKRSKILNPEINEFSSTNFTTAKNELVLLRHSIFKYILCIGNKAEKIKDAYDKALIITNDLAINSNMNQQLIEKNKILLTNLKNELQKFYSNRRILDKIILRLESNIEDKEKLYIASRLYNTK